MFKSLKKLWKESVDFVKDDGVIHMDINIQNDHETTPMDMPCRPPSFGGDETPQCTAIDTEIATLVAEMNRVGIHTTCSCQGHDNGEAYVSIRLDDGTSYEHRKDVFGPGQDELTIRWRREK